MLDKAEAFKLSDDYTKLVRQTAQGSIILLIGQVASTLISAGTMILIASLLGEEKLGEYTVVFVPVHLAILLQDLGSNMSVTSKLAKYKDSDKIDIWTTIATGLTFNALTSTFLAIIIAVFSQLIATRFLHQPDLAQLLRVLSLAIIGQALLSSTNAIFIGRKRMEYQSLTSLIFAVLRAILSPLLILAGLSSLGAVAGYTISIVITGVFGLLLSLTLMRNHSERIPIRPTMRELTSILRFGLPIYLSTLVSSGLSQIYNSLMVLYVTIAEIGNYGAATYFAVLVSFITVPIATSLFPMFSSLKRGSLYLNQTFKASVKYTSILAIPTIGALISLSYPLVQVIYGDKYPLAAQYLQAYLLVYIYIGLGSIATGNLLNSQGESQINFKVALINMIIGTPTALLLIPLYGINGLIVTMVTTPILSVVYSLQWLRKNMGLTIDLTSSAKIYASAAFALLPTIAISLSQINPWIKLVVGAVTYLAAYALAIKLTRTLSEADYQIFRAIIGEKSILARFINPLLNLLK